MRNLFSMTPLLLSVVTYACSNETLAFSTPGAMSTPLGLSIDDCPTLASNVTATAKDGAIVIAKVCIVDDRGVYYASGLSDVAANLPLLPGGHKYSVVYQFGDGWAPNSNVGSGTTAYVAPEALPGSQTDCGGGAPDGGWDAGTGGDPTDRTVMAVGRDGSAIEPANQNCGASACFTLPEDNSGNAVATTTTLSNDVLTQGLQNVVPNGEQVVSWLDYGALYTPALLDQVGPGGFTVRFYVGHVPAPYDGPCPP